MDTRERRILDPSELPTQPKVRLPGFSLPASLPSIPWIGNRGSEDGGRSAVTGAFSGPFVVVDRRKEAGHGGG